jgi:hypothetical protein
MTKAERLRWIRHAQESLRLASTAIAYEDNATAGELLHHADRSIRRVAEEIAPVIDDEEDPEP